MTTISRAFARDAPPSLLERAHRCIATGVSWLVFTVIIGMAGMIGQVIHNRTVGDFEFQSVLYGGELFVVSTVIAADAAGRGLRAVYYIFRGWRRVPKGVALVVGIVVCFVCVFVTAQYYVSSLEGRNPGTEVQAAATKDSLFWFVCTVWAAAVTVVTADD